MSGAVHSAEVEALRREYEAAIDRYVDLVARCPAARALARQGLCWHRWAANAMTLEGHTRLRAAMGDDGTGLNVLDPEESLRSASAALAKAQILHSHAAHPERYAEPFPMPSEAAIRWLGQMAAGFPDSAPAPERRAPGPAPVMRRLTRRLVP